MSIKSKLSVLVQLANIDGEFSDEERQQINMIGKVNGISESEIQHMVEHPEPLPPIKTMTDEDRFEYLYNLVQLMKIDHRIYLSEIKYCEKLAEKLGFKKRVISALSKKIYSQPSITSNIEAMKKEIKKSIVR